MLQNFKVFYRYRFLLEELVKRDFKVRYKRSSLGILWSFLNPLLTMIVLTLVFINLFKFAINNYPIYLLAGITVFNFFSESTSQAMNSVISNFSLITKVYMPKYIFPIAKVLSSSINLGFSFLGLYLLAFFFGMRLNLAHIMIPVGLIYIILFSMGFSMILSSLTVFFRDLQHLYGIVITLWMYLTPIVYPISIISPKIRPLFYFNPLYQYVNFIRTIIADGKFPSLQNHLACIGWILIICVVGLFIFKKTQDKFINYI